MRSRIVEFVGSMIGHVRGGLLQVMIVGVYLSSCISGSKAADMAGRKIDQLGDKSAPDEVRAQRKRRLIKGPSEFREMRGQSPKPKG